MCYHYCVLALLRYCRFSTKCVRRELFCDGRINCAWPYVEPAGRIIRTTKHFQIYFKRFELYKMI